MKRILALLSLFLFSTIALAQTKNPVTTVLREIMPRQQS